MQTHQEGAQVNVQEIEANKRDMPYQSLIKAWLAGEVKRKPSSMRLCEFYRGIYGLRDSDNSLTDKHKRSAIINSLKIERNCSKDAQAGAVIYEQHCRL